MYTITAGTYFWATHSVLLPDGNPEPPHSHNFCVSVEVVSESLDNKGMVMDFCQLKTDIEKITKMLSGTGISTHEYFVKNGQSTEIIAKFIFEKLKSAIPQAVYLKNVIVAEEPGCKAVFSR